MNEILSTGYGLVGLDTTPINITMTGVMIALVVALLLSAVMYFTFKVVHDEMTYDATFNVMLVMLALISTLIIMIVRTNMAISLGMAGTLSLVRFRTNIKDNRDIGFVFLAMFIGITTATCFYFVAVLGTVIICALLYASNHRITNEGSMLLVIRGRATDLKRIELVINDYTKISNLKAHNLLEDSFELVYDIKGRQEDQMYMAQILKSFDGVDSVNVLAPSAQM